MPPIAQEVDFCDRHHWTWWEYYNTPADVLATWRAVDCALDTARARLNPTPTTGITHDALNDED